MSTGEGYEPWVDTANYGWGMDMIANNQGTLMALSSEAFVEDDTEGSTSAVLGLIWMSFDNPEW
jgi:hypothetical protein